MKTKTSNRINTLLAKIDEFIEYLDENEPNSQYMIRTLEEARSNIMEETRITWKEYNDPV